MNAVEIYEKCKSRELITSFNKSGLCISYGSMKKHRNELAKFSVSQSSESGVPLSGHFSPNMFTIAAFDNFDHSDRNTLSGKSSTHDTVTTLFQEMSIEVVSKPNRSEINLKEIKSLSKLPFQELSHFVSNNLLLTKMCMNHNKLRKGNCRTIRNNFTILGPAYELYYLHQMYH